MSNKKILEELIKNLMIEVDDNDKIAAKNNLLSSDILYLQTELDDGIKEGKFKIELIKYFINDRLIQTKRMACFVDESKHRNEISNY